MKLKMMLVLASVGVSLFAKAAEVLAVIEERRVERWSAEGDQWKKLGIFFDAAKTDLKPIGVAATANGKVYVSCKRGEGGVIFEFDATGKKLRTLAETKFAPHMLAVSPDGKKLCVTAYSTTVYAIDLESGAQSTYISGAPLYTRGIKFGPDGNCYLSSTYYGALAVYEAKGKGQPEKRGTILTFGCQGAYDFVGEDLTRLVIVANWRESIDLIKGESDANYPEDSKFRWNIAAVRVGGEIYSADHATARIVRVPSTPGFCKVVATDVGGISQMANLTETFDGSEAKRFAAAKAKLDAKGTKLFVGVPKLVGGIHDLERMSFNNPDAIVDLSTGIWPHLYIGHGEIAIRFGSVPRQGVFRNRQIGDDNYLYTAEEEIDLKSFKSIPEEPYTGYSFPACGCAHFREPRGAPRMFGDIDGDGVLDCIEIANDWTEYGVPGPKCPVAYDKEERWTNNIIQAFAYWYRRIGGRNGKWADPKPILCDGKKDLQRQFGEGGATFHDFNGDGKTDMISGDFRSEIWYYENIGTKEEPAFAKGRHPIDPTGKVIEGDLCMMSLRGFDWDKDGKIDLVVSEEDGRISVFRNTGKVEKGVPVFEPQRFLQQKAGYLKFGCLTTPFCIDWDGDGDEDIITGNSGGYLAFIENLSGKGVEYPKWAAPKLFTVKNPQDCKVGKWLKGNIIQSRCGDENSPQGPAEAKWGYTVVTVGDWDGDGYLDLMANDVKGSVVWIRNPGKVGTTEMEAPRSLEVEWKGEQLRAPWEWRKPIGKTLRAPWRTSPVIYDWDGDGLTDLLMVDTERHFSIYRRYRDEKGVLRLRHPEPLIYEPNGKAREMCGVKGGSGRRKVCICDWDGDGKQDIIVDNGNAVAWLNRGTKNGKPWFEQTPPLARKKLEGHTCCPTTCDFNADGIPDLVIGAEDGHFYYLRNPRSK